MVQTDSPMLDAEDWDIVFTAYAEHPDLALILAHHLIALRELVGSRVEGVSKSIAAIDRAVSSLYVHTAFHKSGRELYRHAVEGTFTDRHQAIIQALGIVL